MKNFVLAAALVAAPVFWAPQAGAVSTYACVKNEARFILLQARISYRHALANGSTEWRRSPWSHTAPHGKTTCIHLGRAPVGQNIYMEVKEPVFGGWLSPIEPCQRSGHTGAVKRTSNKSSVKPRYVSFIHGTNGKCDRGPYFWNGCRGNECSHKTW